tara:strand:- start:2632 stop:3327 length:696 start_codon:yes stop_codon:yes gene_type:complete
MVTPEPQSHGELRERFHQQLAELQEAQLGITTMVDRAIQQSLDSLINRDEALAHVVIAEDNLIDEAAYGLQNQCVVLLAQQGPLAGDLRLVVSVTAIASELERMGDHAEGIAKIVVMMQGEPLIKPLVDIPKMAEKARKMMNDSVQAFINKDVDSAYAVSRADNEVDDLYSTVYHDLIQVMVANPSAIEPATHLLWVAHNLERIADRATNIAERVVYTATGELPHMDTSNY